MRDPSYYVQSQVKHAAIMQHSYQTIVPGLTMGIFVTFVHTIFTYYDL